MSMRLLIVASELYPFVKTGGLADVISSLSRAIAVQGVDVHLILPGYGALQSQIEHVDDAFDVEGPFQVKIPFRLLKCRLRGFALPVWLVDCPRLYQHPGSIYDEPAGLEQNLNAMRFATLSWAAAALGAGLVDNWRADAVHCHDWHAALTPVFLNRFTSRMDRTKPPCILTIHNLAFQGHFARSFSDVLGIRPREIDPQRMLSTNSLCFLELGIRHATRVTTVSPTYAREILTTEYGCGLETVLRARTDCMVGILNGVDYSVWNPAYDPHLPANFQSAFKAEREYIRNNLQSECKLARGSSAPILTFTNRLTHQKMVDVLLDVLPEFVENGAQVIAMGNGQPEYVAGFSEMARKYPDRVFYKSGYDEGLEHRIHAGGDICLSPSRFEPCGLNPLYAMRYGSVPFVRATGGLKDSIVDASPRGLVTGEANGIVFDEPSASGLRMGLLRAIELFSQKKKWRAVQQTGMRTSYRWKSAADEYMALYEGAIQSRNLPSIPNGVAESAFAVGNLARHG